VEAGVHTPGLVRRHVDRVLPVHELIVVQSGVLPIAEDDRRFAVRRDEWVLLQAGRRHYGYDDLDPDTWFYWICFGYGRPDDGIESAVLRGGQTGMVARPDRLRMLFERLLEDQQGAILTPPTAHSYLQLIVAEILLQPPATRQAAPTQAARRAAAFIGNHLTEQDLSTARIAGALAFNPDYLGRAFREASTRQPPNISIGFASPEHECCSARPTDPSRRSPPRSGSATIATSGASSNVPSA
jgi:hypothetical protein